MKPMDIKLSHCFIAVDDYDKALAFYRDVLGLLVTTDASFEGGRWLTLSPPSQPDMEIGLVPVAGHPDASPADREAYAHFRENVPVVKPIRDVALRPAAMHRDAG